MEPCKHPHRRVTCRDCDTPLWTESGDVGLALDEAEERGDVVLAEPTMPPAHPTLPQEERSAPTAGVDAGEVLEPATHADPPRETALTPERLAEIEAQAVAASPGPWRPSSTEYPGVDSLMVWSPQPDQGGMERCVLRAATNFAGQGAMDVAFVAAARQDIPVLIAEVRRLRADREAGARKHVCSYCGHLEEADTHEQRVTQMVTHMMACEQHPARILAEIAGEIPAPEGSAPLTMHDLPGAVRRLREDLAGTQELLLAERDECNDEHPPTPEYLRWCEMGKPDPAQIVPGYAGRLHEEIGKVEQLTVALEAAAGHFRRFEAAHRAKANALKGQPGQTLAIHKADSYGEMAAACERALAGRGCA